MNIFVTLYTLIFGCLLNIVFDYKRQSISFTICLFRLYCNFGKPNTSIVLQSFFATQNLDRSLINLAETLLLYLLFFLIMRKERGWLRKVRWIHIKGTLNIDDNETKTTKTHLLLLPVLVYPFFILTTNQFDHL